MCLAIPAQVVEIVDAETAVVDLSGVRLTVSTALIDDTALGDYLIVHTGFALSRLDPDEAARSLAELTALAAAQQEEAAA